MKPIDNILLIDDNEVVNNLHVMSIEEMEFCRNIHIATNGQKGIDFLNQAGEFASLPSEHVDPELIIVDVKMPVLDGFGFMEEYQKLPAERKAKHKVIMVTSSLLIKDEEKAKSYTDLAAFEMKPLLVPVLKRLCSTLLESNNG